MTHVRTSPYYPQSNGKLERFHKTIKSDHIRKHNDEDLGQMKRSISEYIDHYNNERLHSAIGYVTPYQKLQGLEGEIHRQREEKLAKAREQRKQRRQQLNTSVA